MGLDKNFAVGHFAVLKSQNHDTIVGTCHEILEVKGNTGLIQMSDGGRKYWLSNECIVAIVDTKEKCTVKKDEKITDIAMMKRITPPAILIGNIFRLRNKTFPLNVLK